MDNEFLSALDEALDGIMELPEGTRERFLQYYEYLIDANSRMNLTRIIAPREAAVKHFADSLTTLAFLPNCFPQGAHVVDIGSGAGFPGLPIKLVRPDIDMCLMDSRKKRAEFLEGLIAKLDTGAQVIAMRAEDTARSPLHQGAYDVALVRAVADIKTLCAYCNPLLKPGGFALLYKGEKARAEMADASNHVQKNGFISPKLVETPIAGMNHVIIVLQKSRAAR